MNFHSHFIEISLKQHPRPVHILSEVGGFDYFKLLPVSEAKRDASCEHLNTKGPRHLKTMRLPHSVKKQVSQFTYFYSFLLSRKTVQRLVIIR